VHDAERLMSDHSHPLVAGLVVRGALAHLDQPIVPGEEGFAGGVERQL
jgi:hypothetical protein